MIIDFVYEDEKNLCEIDYEKQFIEIIKTTLDDLKIDDDIEMSCILVDD